MAKIHRSVATEFKAGHSIGIKHGHAYKTGVSPTYYSWKNMKQRCTNPDKHNYYLYGGRGITFCSQWVDFQNFLDDMGERPVGTTLDRINSNGNYEPSNCRWATKEIQVHNKRPSYDRGTK